MHRPNVNPVPRTFFDPANEQHVESFKTFVKTGNWGDIQFYPVLPYTDVPMTVLMTFAEHQLSVKRETEAQRQTRYAKDKPHLVRPEKIPMLSRCLTF